MQRQCANLRFVRRARSNSMIDEERDETDTLRMMPQYERLLISTIRRHSAAGTYRSTAVAGISITMPARCSNCDHAAAAQN